MGFVRDMQEADAFKAATASNLFDVVAELFFEKPHPYRYQRNEIVLWGKNSGVISELEHDFIQKYFPGSMFEFYPLEDMNQ